MPAAVLPAKTTPPRSARRWASALALAAAVAAPARAGARDDRIVFVGNRNLAPVVYLDGDLPSGVAVDLVRALAPRLPRPIEIRAMDWPAAQALVLAGDADALVQMNPSEERRRLYDFSEPLLDSQFSIFARSDEAGIAGARSLRGRRVGVEAGGLPQQVLSKDPEVHLVVIPDFLTGFTRLTGRAIDAVVVDYRVGSYVAARHGIRNVAVFGEPVAFSRSAIAVRKGNARLLAAIDAALLAVRADGTYDRVLERWEPKEVVFWTRAQIARAVGAAAVTVVLLLAGWAGTLVLELRRRRRAEQTLTKQNAILGGIIDGTEASIFSLDRDYRYTSFNAHHAATMRTIYGAEIQLARSLLDYQSSPEDRATARRNLDRALAGEHVVGESYSGGPGRPRRYFRIAHSPIRDPRGEVIGVAVLSHDLTGRKESEETIRRINRELRALTSSNKTMMRATDEPSLLREVCRVVCEEAGYRMAWVGYPEDDAAKTVRPVAWAGFEDGYLATARITWADTERGRGPTGVALRTGRCTCVEDFAVDAHAAPWREEALRRGYRSNAALPLRHGPGRPLGVLSIYSTEPSAFTPDERRLLEELADDLAFGIAVLRARGELERAERARSAHVHFLESMDRVNRAIAGATDLEQMMRDVLDVVLDVLGCDRAFLMYPCDPEAPTWRIPVERCRPGYPGAAGRGAELPMDREIADGLRTLLAADGPVRYGPGAPNPLPADAAARFGFKCFMSKAIHPKVGKPWQFGIHQCSHARVWTADEERLFQEMGRRVADALSTLLVVRDLRDREERLAKAERIVHVGYWDVDLAAGRLALSDEACHIFGLTPGEREAALPEWRTRWAAMVLPDDRDRVAGALAAAESGGPRFDVEYRVVLPGGEARVLHSQADLTRDESGRPLRLLGTVQDVTDRRRAEEALRRSEEQYRRIVETAHEGIWVVDAENRTVFVNRQMARMLGYSVEEMLRIPVLDHFDQDQPAERDEQLERRRRGVAEQRELKLRRKDGSIVWALSESTPLLDERGGHAGLLGMFTDVTERRAIEAQLRQSQKLEAVGRLAGGVAHDFNNLLTAILGNATVLAEELDPGHPLHTEAAEIEATARKAALLTRQLLAFGRKQSLELRVLDLGEVLRAMDRMLRRLIGEDVELSTHVPDDVGRVRADPVQIEQIVLNLAVNARDAMPRGGQLLVEAANVDVAGDEATAGIASPGRYVMLAVRDTGTGMSPEVQAHLFEPFFTTKERGKGTGLGLATVYGIVKQAGGDVRVRTEPGQGTSVEIYLPRHDGPADAGEATPPAPRAASRGSETVLVVEDEPMVRALAVRALRGAGYRVLDAADPEQALKLVDGAGGAALDLLLTDVVMPRLSGPELAERLRAGRPELPVLFASGYMDRVSDVQAQLGRRTGFIPKPFTPAELTHRVRELLDRGEEAPAARA